MDNDEILLQQVHLDMINKYPYLAYLLQNVHSSDTVFDSIPDNIIDYMIVDIEAGRIDDFNIEYNTDGDYYNLKMGFQNYDLDMKFTYNFKVSESLVETIQDCLETIYGEPVEILNSPQKQIPKLKVLKGGKKD